MAASQTWRLKVMDWDQTRRCRVYQTRVCSAPLLSSSFTMKTKCLRAVHYGKIVSLTAPGTSLMGRKPEPPPPWCNNGAGLQFETQRRPGSRLQRFDYAIFVTIIATLAGEAIRATKLQHVDRGRPWAACKLNQQEDTKGRQNRRHPSQLAGKTPQCRNASRDKKWVKPLSKNLLCISCGCFSSDNIDACIWRFHTKQTNC